MKLDENLSRQERIDLAFSNRQKDLALVLENLSEDLNISAILRTAEGFGMGQVFIVHPEGKKPKLSNNVSSGAIKWLDIQFCTSIKECLADLKKAGFTVYATYVNPESENFWQTKFSGKVALVMGNESKGISEEVIKIADHLIYLPMQGLTESFNVSVATALFLYEIVRQKSGI